jgi:hypothetical protein
LRFTCKGVLEVFLALTHFLLSSILWLLRLGFRPPAF